MILAQTQTDHHSETIANPREGERCCDCIHWRDRGGNSHCSLKIIREGALTLHPLRSADEMGCQWLLGHGEPVGMADEF